jgi:hypothetical protein
LCPRTRTVNCCQRFFCVWRIGSAFPVEVLEANRKRMLALETAIRFQPMFAA